MTQIRYWDSSSTASDWGNEPYYHSASATGYNWIGSTTPSYIYRRRRIVVEHPEHWSDDNHLAFVKLVNHELRCGWIVTMLIKGDILITDPNVEKRTMAEFVPLLRWWTIGDDHEKINAFFEKHPFNSIEGG